MSANAWEVLFVVTVSLMRNTVLLDLLNLYRSLNNIDIELLIQPWNEKVGE
jgi:hypothetical protein